MDVLTSIVLSHFHTVSMLLSLKSILPLSARGGFKWQCYEKLHVDQFRVLKGLNQSNKIGMLHKIRPKTLISMRSPSPSPIVPLVVLSRMFSPNPLPPSYFILVEIHKLLIGMWCLFSTTVPVAIQIFFVFLCAFFVETNAAAPTTMSLG